MLKKNKTDFSLQALLIKEPSEKRKDTDCRGSRMREPKGATVWGGNPNLLKQLWAMEDGLGATG